MRHAAMLQKWLKLQQIEANCTQARLFTITMTLDVTKYVGQPTKTKCY